MAQTSFTLEQIVAGLADTRIGMEAASLCDNYHHLWISHIIPIPKPHVLRSGYVPSTAEVDHILLELREERAELGTLDKEITRLNDVLSRAHTARTQLVHRMKRRQSVVSAIRRVPFDVWAIIFQCANSMMGFSLDCFEIDGLWNRKRLVSLPHSLSRVCKQWKEMVDSLPGLWTSIRIRGLPHLKTDIRPLLMEYFSKSSERRLKVSTFEENPKEHTSSYYQSSLKKRFTPLQQDVILLLMKGVGARCEELDFQLNNCDFHSEPSELIGLPILRSIHLGAFAGPVNQMYGWLVRMLKQAPHCWPTRFLRPQLLG
ncbi:hypothetical protein PM082_013881 [Marasmius tenuissimus]|nr:hypothetical protein PM082_013881 [Marasmius tenuissimus]